MSNHISHSGLAKLASGSTVNSETIATATPGTWAPTIGDGTNNFSLTAQSGQYINCGGITFFWIALGWNSKGSASGNIRISLPGEVGSGSFRCNPAIGYCVGINVNDQLVFSGDSGTDYLIVFTLASGGSPTLLTDAAFLSTGYVQVNGMYSIV